MIFENEINTLANIIESYLRTGAVDRPYASGNTVNNGIFKNVSDKGITIKIAPEPYDIETFLRTGQLVFETYKSGKKKGQFRPRESYAYTVNYITGGWSGSHKFWVEKNCKLACETFTHLYGGSIKENEYTQSIFDAIEEGII